MAVLSEIYEAEQLGHCDVDRQLHWLKQTPLPDIDSVVG